MDELIENLLYAATFPEMDKWRRFSAAPEPPEHVMRIFTRAELRLQHRYGLIELERLAEAARVRREMKNIWGKLHGGAPLAAVLMGLAVHIAMPLFYPRTHQA